MKVSIGGLLGVDVVISIVALSSFLFAGSLSFGTSTGLFVLILSTIIISISIWLFSEFKSVIALAQDNSIAILAPALAAAAAATNGASQETILATCLAILGITAILSGIFTFLAGKENFGRYLKMIPHSVSVGFLASSGYSIAFAGLAFATGTSNNLDFFHAAFELDSLYILLPAICLGLLLFACSRVSNAAIILIAILLTAIIALYVALWVFGISMGEAREAGFLQANEVTNLKLPDLHLVFVNADFAAILFVAIPIAGATLINVLSCMMSYNGFEISIGEEKDVSRELRTTGSTNLVIGSFGGISSYIYLGGSSLTHKFGAGGSVFHLSYIAVLVGSLIYADYILAYTPILVAAGFLFYIGLSLVSKWLLETRKSLPTSEWLVVLTIVIITAFWGLLNALFFGLLFAIVLFVVNYAKLPIIRTMADGEAFRSNVDRSSEAQNILAREGHLIKVITLQGYLFFGSIDSLIARLKEYKAGEVELLILDLKNVAGMDSAAASGFKKLEFMAKSRSINLVLCGLNDQPAEALDLVGINTPKGAFVHFDQTLDGALEWCENQLIEKADNDFDAKHSTAAFLSLFGKTEKWLNRLEIVEGTSIIKAGDTDKDIYFVAEGSLSVWIKTSDNKKVRVRRMTSGAVVGEMASLAKVSRTADIVADEDCVVYQLEAQKLEQLEAEEPSLSVGVYKFLAENLAGAVIRSNRMISQSNP